MSKKKTEAETCPNCGQHYQQAYALISDWRAGEGWERVGRPHTDSDCIKYLRKLIDDLGIGYRRIG